MEEANQERRGCSVYGVWGQNSAGPTGNQQSSGSSTTPSDNLEVTTHPESARFLHHHHAFPQSSSAKLFSTWWRNWPQDVESVAKMFFSVSAARKSVRFRRGIQCLISLNCAARRGRIFRDSTPAFTATPQPKLVLIPLPLTTSRSRVPRLPTVPSLLMSRTAAIFVEGRAWLRRTGSKFVLRVGLFVGAKLVSSRVKRVVLFCRYRQF